MDAKVSPERSFWAGKRVLLTGHTGFKGAWASIWLKELGAEVHGLALPPHTEPSLWALAQPSIAGSYYGDVRDTDFVRSVFQAARPELVLHMAAQALVRESYDRPSETFDTNVLGLIRVLDAARETPTVRAFVNVTSDKCYENKEQIWAYRETDPMGGADPYSASKGCAELVTSSYRNSFFSALDGPQLASARAGNVIGGGDWAPDRLVPDCLRAFQTGQPVLLRNPASTRPWQHVLEPICGYFLLAQALYERGSEVAEGWNFGPPDDDAWPVSRVVEQLVRAWGGGASWALETGAQAHEAKLLGVDSAKARRRLHWAPLLSVEQALDWTVTWTKQVHDGRAPLAVTLEQITSFELIAMCKKNQEQKVQHEQ